ncbi:type II toxin-antitoxin system HicA family toxin [Deinococcus misasensis]|uniref:type II toxin-antitoxin system HicA family toxin n=1 Tax=Deinococcus misasensis TaxID=392413 RepID=UPI000551EF46|nr:type II toxin-antitoxin system HicA family toxin [Deinococcus misasensis]
MKYRQIRKLFKKAGWKPIRQEGSHEQWSKDGQLETIAGHDGDDIDKGLLNKYLKRLGLK